MRNPPNAPKGPRLTAAFAAAGFVLNEGLNARPQRPNCPNCGSINTYFLKSENQWRCNSTKGVRLPMGAYKPKCGHHFTIEK